MKRYFIIFVSLFILSGCSLAKYSTVVQHSPFEKYKFFYVLDAASTTATSASVYGNQYALHGSQVTKTVSPTDIISGVMMKQG